MSLGGMIGLIHDFHVYHRYSLKCITFSAIFILIYNQDPLGLFKLCHIRIVIAILKLSC